MIRVRSEALEVRAGADLQDLWEPHPCECSRLPVPGPSCGPDSDPSKILGMSVDPDRCIPLSPPYGYSILRQYPAVLLLM